MQLKRILVTGATGFIGKNLAMRLVDSGHKVFGSSRSEARDADLEEIGVEPIRMHLETDASWHVPPVDIVFHLAGRLAGTLEELVAVNGDGTGRLLRRITEARDGSPNGLPVFVLLSSLAASGPSTRSRPKQESDPPTPISDYGRSKLAGERAASNYAEVGFPVSIVRPGIVFGPGDKEFLRILQSMYRIFLSPAVGGGQSPLAFAEVGELADLLMLIAERGERVSKRTIDGDPWSGSGIYNAASPGVLSLRSLGSLFARTLDRPVLPLWIPKPLGWLFGWGREVYSRLLKQPLTLTRDKMREALAESWAANPRKAIELGWQPKDIESSMSEWILKAKSKRLL
jgi:nucleoside-diphosphate-sugar epimerase